MDIFLSPAEKAVHTELAFPKHLESNTEEWIFFLVQRKLSEQSIMPTKTLRTPANPDMYARQNSFILTTPTLVL